MPVALLRACGEANPLEREHSIIKKQHAFLFLLPYFFLLFFFFPSPYLLCLNNSINFIMLIFRLAGLVNLGGRVCFPKFSQHSSAGVLG